MRNGGSARRRSTTGNKRSHRLRRGILIGLAVVLVLTGAGLAYTYHITHDLQRTDVRGLSGALTTGKEAGTENILMVGSTSRCALAKQNPDYGLCSEGVNGVNGDVIMILHVDPAAHRLALLSLPRDLFIPNARTTGANKIDAGLYQGMTQMVAAIEEDFGIPIQHAVSLNFDQFANVVNALGGIDMSFPESVYDEESGLNVKSASCVHLDGTEALQVVRARHLQYDAPGTDTSYAADWPQEGLSDLARIDRDHEFLRVLATAVAKRNLDDPITDVNLINSLKADLTFDQSWSVRDMADLVLDFHSVHIDSVPQLTLPVSVVYDPEGDEGGLIYQGFDYGDVEFPSEAQDQATIDAVLGIGPTIDAMTGNALPKASSVSVSVMNGTGTYDQAHQTADNLAALGFKTVGVGDGTPTGDLAETIVYYGSRSVTTEAAAEAVARSITGSVIMAYDPSEVADRAQVTVVTGSAFTVKSPPSPSKSSTTSPTKSTVPSTTTTTTTTTTSPASSAIAPPSPSNPGLAAYDPRACPASAASTPVVLNPVNP